MRRHALSMSVALAVAAPCALAQIRPSEAPAPDELRRLEAPGHSAAAERLNSLDPRSAVRVGPPDLSVAAPRGTPPFDYFDGFETYEIDPDPSDQNFVGIRNQTAPSGEPVNASSFLIAVDAAHPSLPASLSPPPDPFMGGPPQSGDRDPNVDQVLMNAQGILGERFVGSLLGVHWEHARFGMSADEPLISTMDFFFEDHATASSFNWHSNSLGVVISIVLFGGKGSSHDFADPATGEVRRPVVLGRTNNGQSGVSSFVAPPIDPAVGLPTFEKKLGEWFTVAFVSDIDLGMRIFIRDSETDGSGAILIDDPLDVPGFEIGWTQIYPGAETVNIGAAGGAQVWTGYGIAVDRNGQEATATPPIGNFLDSMFTVIGFDPDENEAPDFTPANSFLDNYTVIGAPLDGGLQPKRRLPFIDDLERAVPGPISAHGWRESLVNVALVVDDPVFNTTPPPGSDGGAPSNSALIITFNDNSNPRWEVGISDPTGEATRLWADGGEPGVVSATLRTDKTAARAVRVHDGDLDQTSEWLWMGVTDPADDSLDDRFHIRLPNPLFDRALLTLPGLNVDEAPDLGVNAETLNWPTTTVVPPETDPAFLAELILFGDGTAEWRIDGAPLVFDPAFYSLDPALEAHLQGADPDGAPPFSRFPTDLRTITDFELWTGANTGAAQARLRVDDVLIDGTERRRAPGPAFDLPYADDFSNYALDEPLANQGETPFRSIGNLGFSVAQTPIDGLEIESQLPVDPETLWCRYEIAEVVQRFEFDGTPLPNEWPVTTGDVLHVRRPLLREEAPPCPADLFGDDGMVGSADLALLLGSWGDPGATDLDDSGATGSTDLALLLGSWGPCPLGAVKPFSCPEPETAPNVGNLILRDGSGSLAEQPVKVALLDPAEVESDGVGDGADLHLTLGRYEPGRLFCRYELTQLPEPQIDPDTGELFDCPWQIGDVVAVDPPFGENIFGQINCPGFVNGAMPSPSRFNVESVDGCLTCDDGRWVNVDTASDPACDASQNDITLVAGLLDACDIVGYADAGETSARWGLPLGFFSDARASAVVDASSETDGATAQPIDPSGLFDEVAGFTNPETVETNGAITLVNSALPEAFAENGGVVRLCWDLYLQDVNTQHDFEIVGREKTDLRLIAPIARLVFGGPDIKPVYSSDGATIPVPQENIGIEIANPNTGGLFHQPEFIFVDTGVAAPLNQWFRVCLELNENGEYWVGMNLSGIPGGPGGPIATGGDGLGDRPELYDQNLPGAHPDAVLIARDSVEIPTTGVVVDLISLGRPSEGPCTGEIPVINSVTGFSVESPLDPEGDGFGAQPPVQIRALAPDAPAPNGASATTDDQYCFYDLRNITPGDAPPPVIDVDHLTGEPFDFSPADGVADTRPARPNDTLAIRWGSPAGSPVTSFEGCPDVAPFEFVDAAGTTIASGEWRLLGDAFDEPQRTPIIGGVSNPAGPGETPIENARSYDFFGEGPKAPMLMAEFVTIPAGPAPELRSRWWLDNLTLEEVPAP